MIRQDLLSLTADDLTALSNAGTVKRATREVTTEEVTGQWVESPAGDVTVTWSDAATCSLPAGVALGQARCSCPSTGVCRHLIRTVLGYQKNHAQTATQPLAPVAWNPGDIPDELLTAKLRAPVLARQKAIWNGGIVAELTRGTKPIVRFHQPQATIRFMVPGDVNYTDCDCAEKAPCPHVALAVWAFRELPAEQTTGLISTAGRPSELPEGLTTELEEVVRQLWDFGISGATQPWYDRLKRLTTSLEKAGLIWPAEILDEVREEAERYTNHDAGFTPTRIVDLLGEALARQDAIEHDTNVIPQILVRGSPVESTGSLGKTRLIGLGCRVEEGTKETQLVTYLQDANSGAVLVLTRNFAKDPTTTARKFHGLASSSAVKSFSFGEVARGQLVIEGGQRTASLRLRIGRANATLQPQNFSWEQLKSPTLVEDYAILLQRLAFLPPTSLRPRRAADDFFALTVAEVIQVVFDAIHQQVLVSVQDSQGTRATIRHPYTDRGRGGTETLLQKLADKTLKLKFVAGNVTVAAGAIQIAPSACIFEDSQGQRLCVLPWCEPDTAQVSIQEASVKEAAIPPMMVALKELHKALEELLMLGLTRCDMGITVLWSQAQRNLESVGLVRLGALAERVVSCLEAKPHQLNWKPTQALDALLRLQVLLRLARDVEVQG
ncbi:MAG: hypothetical protein ACRC8S_17415 [Fimbriiglobus sp.]